MSKSRSATLAIAWFGLAAVACGAGGTEPEEAVGSTGQAVAATCTVSVASSWAPSPAAPTRSTCDTHYVEAWGVARTSRTCDTITTPTGAWTLASASYVEEDDGWYQVPPSCTDVGLPADCCLYTWAGSTDSAVPDTGALCAAGQAIVELEGCWVCSPSSSLGGRQTCQLPRPSSGGCTTCRLE